MSSLHCRPWWLLFACLPLLGLSACGTMSQRPAEDATPPAAQADQNNTRDPFEGFNRTMYSFNDKLDRYALKPLAKGYRAITPAPVRKSVANFFSNLHDPVVMLNNLLQGKPGRAASDFSRFLVNTTFGVFGLFDVATKWDLPKHNEDFGQTLAVWGVGDGPYLVLPFFGPSNMRDAPALVVDWETYPPNRVKGHSGTRDKMFVLEVIDKRAQLLDASDILQQAAGEDPYIFVREAYRQQRRSLIYDGNPPQAAPPPGLFEEEEPAPPAPREPAPEKSPPPASSAPAPEKDAPQSR